MPQRRRHQKKEVEDALKYAEAAGWVVTIQVAGHHWGVARCGHGCVRWVFSTPKNAGNHAKRIREAVNACKHQPRG
jgi:hypothetical protein